MKRTALNHSKTKKLSRLLHIPHYGAVGILECLWHLTSNEAPRGDIGKLSDEDIAFSIDWESEPGDLINSLIDAGWIDRNEDHRLIVHDWPEHCEDSIDARLYRAGLIFADGTQPQGKKVGSKEKVSIVGKKSAPVLDFQQPSAAESANRQPKNAEAETDDFSPSEVASAVVQESQAGGDKALMTLTDIAKSLMNAGSNATDARDRMLAAWAGYSRAATEGKLKWTYSGIEKFFAGGLWDKEKAWPWKEDDAKGRSSNTRTGNTINALREAAEQRGWRATPNTA